MQIGAMTNPHRDLLPQVRWIGEQGFDYLDLAVEPPRAAAGDLDCRAVREAAAVFGMEIVVHTSPFLPVASAHAGTRRAAWEELAATVPLALELGSSLMTLHYIGAPPFFSGREVVDTYAGLLDRLAEASLRHGGGVRIALENSPFNRNEALLFHRIFRQAPDALLLLDVGHTHIGGECGAAAAFLNDPFTGPRLAHVHLSDNDGKSDLHLPLGAARGGIDWRSRLADLRRHPYDGRMTLEVFSPDREYLLLSRDKLRRWWGAAA